MKKITIPEIAKLANVSIGTVDRAINNRPGISPKTKEKILEITKEYNYRPNRLSKALANNKIVNIGMITLPNSIPFIKKIIKFAQAEAESLYDYGCRLSIKSLETFEVDEELKIIQEFINDNFDAISIGGLDHPEIAKKINLALEKGISVVTFNADVSHSKRLCFVGQNLFQSGKIAADLLCKFMGRTGKLYIMQGYHKVAAHTERLSGFMDVVKKEYPKIEIVNIDECFDDDKIAYIKTAKILQNQPDLAGIYVVASGELGAAKAISEANLSRHISFVCNDYIEGTRELLEQNIIDATILQDPEAQGRLPIKILFNSLFDKQIINQKIFETKTQIIIKHLK